jgi:hypothetical protein
MLEVSDGAANVNLDFSSPNLVEMSTLRYSTGASNVELSGLGNANFTSMIFRCGAGDYTLDFNGQWLRDAVVSIESGMSQVRLIVPEGLSARVIFKGGMTSVEAGDAWEKDGDEYILVGSGPTILINVDMGAFIKDERLLLKILAVLQQMLGARRPRKRRQRGEESSGPQNWVSLLTL